MNRLNTLLVMGVYRAPIIQVRHLARKSQIDTNRANQGIPSDAKTYTDFDIEIISKGITRINKRRQSPLWQNFLLILQAGNGKMLPTKNFPQIIPNNPKRKPSRNLLE